MLATYMWINTGKSTEWSPIWSDRVFNHTSDSQTAGVRFINHEYD